LATSGDQETPVSHVAEATAVEEPALTGVRIDIESKSFPVHLNIDNERVPFHGDLSNWEHFEGAVLAIGIRGEKYLEVVGSAVLVGPGIALAARHVFTDHMSELESGKFSCFAFGISPEGGVLWSVKHLHGDASDVVILALKPASRVQSKIVSAVIASDPPAIGEKIMLVGFRAAKVEGNSMEMAATAELLVSVGHVAEVFPEGRDRVMLPFPCVEVRCKSVGGMSGGAAFDTSGNLFGILTSSFDGHEGPSHQGPSYVSLLHTALDRPIENLGMNFDLTMPCTLRDFHARKLLAIADGRRDAG